MKTYLAGSYAYALETAQRGAAPTLPEGEGKELVQSTCGACHGLGNVTNSVNFPEVAMPRAEGYRVAIVNSNVPNMVGQFSTAMARAGLNILDMLNKSRGTLAYTLADVDQPISQAVIDEIARIEGVMAVRTP